ncbi:MAG TPA: DUF4363 family protein [Bacillota bacterium]|nr:DUF4363 family protein [Bacillota bacterium]
MKAFWIVLAATAVLFIAWGLFISSADADIEKMKAEIDSAITAISVEEWDKGQDAIDNIFRQWKDKRLVFSLFFDAISIGEAEASLFKADAYTKAREKGSAMAELAYIRHRLSFLYENEKITIENIL